MARSGEDRMTGCWDILNCAFIAADGAQQARYSSAATILGLLHLLEFKFSVNSSCLTMIWLPTVMSMMAASSHELLQIHSRFPLPAFLISLCNPSIISMDVHAPKITNAILQSKRSSKYNHMINKGIRIPGL